MPDMSNHQACRDVEANEDLSTFNRRSPTRLGVQREAYVLKRASAAMKVPEHANVIREPSDSRLATSPIPLAPGSLVALTSPVIAQGSLLPSYSGPAGGACPDRRPRDEDSNEPTVEWSREEYTELNFWEESELLILIEACICS
jgi:hypothetical protein